MAEEGGSGVEGEEAIGVWFFVGGGGGLVDEFREGLEGLGEEVEQAMGGVVGGLSGLLVENGGEVGIVSPAVEGGAADV